MIDFERISQNAKLKALAVIGSRARGDCSEHSDYDLIGLSEKCNFIRFTEDQYVIELHTTQSVLDWSSKPSWWYALECIDIKVDDGTIGSLPSLAKQWQKNYCPSEEDIRRNLYWIESVVRKILGSNSDLKLAYILETNLWEILTGSFLSRSMPMPANSDMFRLAPSIIGKELFRGLLCGTLVQKRKIAMDLCREIIETHNKALELTGGS